MKLRHNADDETSSETKADAGNDRTRDSKADRGLDLDAAATTKTGEDKVNDGLAPPTPYAGPAGPSGLKAKGVFAALRRTFKQFSEDNVSDWAAALTYYGVLSIFPAALVLVSIVGLLSANGQKTVTDTINEIASNKQIQDLVATVLGQVKDTGTAGFAAIIGIGLFIAARTGLWVRETSTGTPAEGEAFQRRQEAEALYFAGVKQAEAAAQKAREEQIAEHSTYEGERKSFLDKLASFQDQNGKQAAEIASLKGDIERIAQENEKRPVPDEARALSATADQAAAIEIVRSDLRADDVVLVKGSRYRTWDVVDALRPEEESR